MAEHSEPRSKPGDNNPFDVQLLERLISLMKENDLAELSLQQRGTRIRLSRGGCTPVLQASPAMTSYAGPMPSPSATSSPPPTKESAADHSIYITSPTVGTFYQAPNPESPAYVKVGSKVSPDTIVCLIEAMKVYNDIPAGVSGVIEEVLVENASAVEYGQRLFRVRPA
jgi:acetyl-CoA carboxylase biotin carboxyl carrier protein